MESTGSSVVRFGVFEVDLEARELRKRGVRIKLQEQPFRLLEALLERPREIITREEIQQRLWPDDTFVDFDKSLNTAAQKVRLALNDSADSPRFVETIPRRGYRFVAPIELAANTADLAAPPTSPLRNRPAAVLALVAAATAVAWMLWPGGAEPRTLTRTPRQLTTDTGLTAWPDITPDGKLVVYSSDRDGGPDLDLWLHHIDRNETTQLTDQPGDEIQPRFAPDGSRVVYTSRTSNVYIVPTVGGEPTLIARHARTARFSPDGQTLAYTKDNPNLGYAANLVLADVDGSDPRVIDHGMRFLGVGNLWLPDGRLLTGGNPGRVLGEGGWYLISSDGTRIQQAGKTSTLGYSRPPPFEPLAWLEHEQAVLFSASEGDSIDLWKRPISLAASKVDGPSVRFTSSGSLEYDAAAAPGGRVVYSSMEQNIDLWRLALDGDGRAAGPPTALTTGLAAEHSPVLSGDGGTLAFRTSASSGNVELSRIQISRMFPFAPKPLFEGEASYRKLALATDGREIVYGLGQGLQRTVLSTSTLEGTPRNVCTDCGELMDWSPDRRYVLHRGSAEARQIVAFDTRGGKHQVVAEHPAYPMHDAKLSPDQRSIVFHAQTQGVLFRRVFVSPFQIDRATSEEDWIALTGSEDNSYRPEWSPDGEWLYYFSNQGGPIGIWAQRFDRKTREPVGDPRLVYEGGGEQPTFTSDFQSGMGQPKMAVGLDFIVFDTIERRGNVWLLDPVEESAH